jgi:4-amino-4-deoxy-L-arabinose transferase-like glycosyltransferase
MTEDNSGESRASGSPTPLASAIALTVVLAASAVAGWMVFTNLVLLDRPPLWDEACHILQGSLIAYDVRQGDLFATLFDTYRQIYWPPLQPWLVGVAFLTAGPSLETARAVSVLALVLLAPTLYLIARTVELRHGILAGCVAAALALTAPGLIALSAVSMLEMPGLLALSCTLLVYCALERYPDAPPRAYVLLGFFTVVTYLVKTHLAVLIVISVILTKLIAARFDPRRLLTKQNLYAVLPLALFCAIWFAYPPRILYTWDALVNNPWGGEEARGLAGLLFYPRAIIQIVGWTSVLLVGGIALAWKARDEPGIGFLAVIALVMFVIGEIHHTKLDRHIIPILPPLFVLTGVAGARLWAWLRAHGWMAQTEALVLLAIMAFLQSQTFGRLDRVPRRAGYAVEVLNYVSAQAREHAPVLVLGTQTAKPAPPVLDWNLVHEGLLHVTSSGTAVDPPLERRLAVVMDDARIPQGLRARARRVFERYDASTMARTLHPFSRYALHDQSRYAAAVETTIGRDPPHAIIAMIATSDTTTQTVDFVSPAIVSSGFRQTSVRDFPHAQTRVYVYRRP